MFKKIALAFVLVISALSAQAGQEVSPAKGGMCGGIGVFNAGGESAFDCEHLGRVTIKQIYERGWRVASSGFLPEKAISVRSYMYLIIEEQKK